MSTNPDYKDLFRIFSEEKVDYLVVGAHAVLFHAEPRYTNDLVRAKRAAGRPQDMLDLENLQQTDGVEDQ